MDSEGGGRRRGRPTCNLCPRVWFMMKVAASTHMKTRMKPFIKASEASVPSVSNSSRRSGSAMVEACCACCVAGGKGKACVGNVRRHACVLGVVDDFKVARVGDRHACAGLPKARFPRIRTTSLQASRPWSRLRRQRAFGHSNYLCYCVSMNRQLKPIKFLGEGGPCISKALGTMQDCQTQAQDVLGHIESEAVYKSESNLVEEN